MLIEEHFLLPDQVLMNDVAIGKIVLFEYDIKKEWVCFHVKKKLP